MTSLKLLVNKETNQLLYAESDADFVDILFSFLTMPLGSTPCRSNLGSLGTLWKSVNDLDTQLLQTSECKNMLLHPNNALGRLCKNLKVNIVGSDPTYYICPSYKCFPKTVSTSSTTRCRLCGVQMSQIVMQGKCNEAADGKDGLFVKGKMKFLITDDLQVSPVSTLPGFALLKKLGVSDATVLEVRNVHLSKDKEPIPNSTTAHELLTRMLISKTPLTDVFLRKQNTECGTKPVPQEMVDQIENDNDDKSKRLRIKLLLSRSSNKVLYAESGEGFPDMLFSFLTAPLGSVVRLLGGKTGMGCLDNLYKSFQDLSLQDCMKSQERTAMLLKNQFVGPHIFYYCRSCEPNFGYCLAEAGGNRTCLHGAKGIEISNLKPRSFVAGPAMFVVTDELSVQPLSPTLGISLINNFGFPISDLEEVVVNVGEKEASSLLRALLKSKTVLTDVFCPKKPNYSRKRSSSDNGIKLERSSDNGMSETDKHVKLEI